MRYGRLIDLFQLALRLQASREGLSLSDIREQFAVSRRTAERMRDAILRAFPQTEEVDTGGAVKRWRLPGAALGSFTAVTADELAALQGAATLLRRDNRERDAAALALLGRKLEADMRPATSRRVGPDLEALLEAEGLAMRPGPRPRIFEGVLMDLREAIKRCVRVRIRHRNRETGRWGRQTVCPYGLLYGNRHYLVAYSLSARSYRLYSLSDIATVELTTVPFQRRQQFSLQSFAARSFGVFQEEPFDVVWKFSPEAAADAREFIFHPSQTLEQLADGSLIVRFRAGGALEMCWHLFTWGQTAEIISPQCLRHLYRRLRN